MRITVQEDSHASVEDFEVFRAMHLMGSGRVQASVDERMLSFETRKGRTLTVRLSNILRVHHHHTRLVPFGFALFGAGLLYIARRILIPDMLQMVVAICGVAFIFGWAGTRKPTLTIDTDVGDCHTIIGNDASLMRMSTLLKRLLTGMSMDDARIGLDILNRNAEFPQTSLLEMQEIPVQNVHLSSSPSIASFLTQELPVDELPDSISSMDGFEQELELDFDGIQQEAEGWILGEPNPQSETLHQPEHGLMRRGIENAHDRRGTIPHTVSGIQQHYPAHFNQSDPAVQHSPPISSYQQLAQSSHSEMNINRHQVHTTEVPTQFIPSFIGPEGAHIPQRRHELNTGHHASEFHSPDSILPVQIDEEQPSLIELAKRETPKLPEITDRNPKPSAKNNSRLRPKGAQNTQSRLRPKSRTNNPQTGRLRELVRPAAAQMFESATGFASRLLSSKSGNKEPIGSTSTDELRQRSAQTHQSEAIESILNLAASRGGNLPDDEIEIMLAHLERRHTFLEQEMQEEIPQETPQLESFSFEELKDSKTLKSEQGGRAGLPRIDV